MRVTTLLVGGALVLGACGARANIITIDPSTFSPGQYISYATPGVTLSTMTLVPVEPLALGSAFYGPELGPVFASGDAFASSASDSWGFSSPLVSYLTECLQGCPAPLNANNGQWLRLDFSSPVNYVSVIQLEFDANTSSEIAGFDSSGQLEAKCVGWLDAPAGSCSTAPGYNTTMSLLNGMWLNESIFSSSDDISTVLIGNIDPNVSGTVVGTIQFGTVPEPATLSLMGLGLLGIAWSQRRRFRRSANG